MSSCPCCRWNDSDGFVMSGAQVPGLPAPIENMILRYVKQKADWWTQVVRTPAQAALIP